MSINKFVFLRAALGIAVLFGSFEVASAQEANARGGMTNAAAGTNGGPTQTVIVNTSSNPVPTLSVGTTTVAGAITVANAQSSPVPVSDPDRRPQNRLTISTWKTNSGTSWTGTVNAFGQRTAISALPAGKMFVVTDVELEATGTNGAAVLVDVLHSSSQYPEFESSLVVSATGRVTERIHLIAGPVFADLPTMWFAGGQAVSATLWGYLVDAQ